MTGKNETRALLLSLLVTMGVVGAGAWFLNGQAPIKPPPTAPTASTPIVIDSFESFTKVKPVPSGTFNYGGSTTWATIRGSIDSKIQEARPEFRLNYVQQPGVAPSTQSGIELLAQDKVAFSLASRLLTPGALQALKNQGIQLTPVLVAYSFDVIAVNPSLPISKLTLEQIKGIQTGKINNWNEVGGPDLPIQQFDRDVNPDAVESKAGTEGNIEFLTTPLEQLRKIAKTPGSFAKIPASLAVPQCTVKALEIVNAEGKTISPYKAPLASPAQCLTQKNQINLLAFKSEDYPSELKNPLYVVINQNGQIEQQVGVAYTTFLRSDEGKRLLEKEGYVASQE